MQGKRPYGEESRRYRRTVYRHSDWLKHRSETRLLRNLRGTFTSGVVRSLISEVAAVAVMSLVVIVWNSVAFGYQDLSNISHAGLWGEDGIPAYLRMALPISIFTLSSPALGLLLVFRTNTSYSRWLEARQAWGRIVSHCRNIMRQSTLWIDDTDATSAQCLEELRLCVWAFPRSLWAHVSDPAKEPRFAREVADLMGDDAAAVLLEAEHRPLRALSLLSASMDRLPIDEKKKVEMDKSVILLGDACDTCERIFSSPVPLVYTRHTARFLSTWLLVLPLGLWDQFEGTWNHLPLVPASVLVAIFLFGIEELAVQLEEPFSILPLETLCADVLRASTDMVEGMRSTREPLPIKPMASGEEEEEMVVVEEAEQPASSSPGRRRTGDAKMVLVDPASTTAAATAAIAVLPPMSMAVDAGSVMTTTSPAAVTALLSAVLSTAEQQQRYFAAGGLCASISHAVATPIDVVKTRQQTVPSYSGVPLLQGLARVAADEGPAALFTGIAPTVIGYGAEGALKFGTYEALKPAAAQLLGASLGPIASAVVAGGLASLVLAPTEATRIRMVSDPTYAARGFLGAATRLYETEGAAGLLRGVPATCSKQLPYTATKQVTFDALIDVASRSSSSSPAALLLPRWASTVAAAACAAILSTLASQPGDAILSEVSRGGSSDGEDGTKRGRREKEGGEDQSGIVEVVARLGAGGLVQGLEARLVQVGIIVTVQLILYDSLKHAFGVP